MGGQGACAPCESLTKAAVGGFPSKIVFVALARGFIGTLVIAWLSLKLTSLSLSP